MSALDAFLIILAVLALLGVIFEEVIHINKAKVTLFFGTMSWMLLFLFSDVRWNVSAGTPEGVAVSETTTQEGEAEAEEDHREHQTSPSQREGLPVFRGALLLCVWGEGGCLL